MTKVSTGSDLFLNIHVRPAADLSKLEEVLVVTKIDERQTKPSLPTSACGRHSCGTITDRAAEVDTAAKDGQAATAPSTAPSTKPGLSKPAVIKSTDPATVVRPNNAAVTSAAPVKVAPASSTPANSSAAGAGDAATTKSATGSPVKTLVAPTAKKPTAPQPHEQAQPQPPNTQDSPH